MSLQRRILAICLAALSMLPVSDAVGDIHVATTRTAYCKANVCQVTIESRVAVRLANCIITTKLVWTSCLVQHDCHFIVIGNLATGGLTDCTGTPVNPPCSANPLNGGRCEGTQTGYFSVAANTCVMATASATVTEGIFTATARAPGIHVCVDPQHGPFVDWVGA